MNVEKWVFLVRILIKIDEVGIGFWYGFFYWENEWGFCKGVGYEI